MSVFVHGQLMDQIKRDLVIVKECIQLNVSTGHTDANKDAENFYCGLLNTAFGWRLKNLNSLKMDFPAIDLGDTDSKVCIQVTSTEGREKVRNTLKKFFDHKLHTGEGYERLIVLIIGDKPAYRDDFAMEDGFDFEPNRDIWDTAKLIQEIEAQGLEAAKAVAEYLGEQLNIPRAKNPGLRLPFSAMDRNAFVGRENELAELARKLKDSANTPIVVSGLGGMGKTELVARFCADYRGGNVYFVRFRGDFTQTVAVGVASGLAGYKDRKPDLERDYAEAMAQLQNCAPGDILVIDNADEPEGNFGKLQRDSAWQDLRQLNLRLILTTRCEVSGAIRVGNMANKTLYRIFENQGLTLDAARMDALIEAVNGHTMTVDLMARTLKRTRTLTVDRLLAALRKGDLPRQRVRPVDMDRNGAVEQKMIYDHLRKLFNVAEISPEARDVLRNTVLLPEGGMDIEILEAVLDEEKMELLEQQIDHGWLSFDQDTRFVTIHPVVRLVCREELKPNDKNCGAFLYAVWGYYDPKQYNAETFRQFAELFSRAAELLPDGQSDWAIRAGHFWKEIGQAGNALPYELQAVSRLEVSRPESEVLARAYNNVGHTYGALGDHKKALEYKLKALKIWETVLPANHPDLALSYNNVGYTYGDLGDHEKALEYKLKALEIFEKVLPANHPSLATSYNNVGATYGALGDHEKELEYQLKALEIGEKVLPANHPALATSYNNVGGTYGDLGNHEKALEYQLKALKIRETVLPANHPDLALSYNNVGGTYGDLGDHEKDLEYQLKALEIFEKVLPANHPDLAGSYNNVGATYGALGDHEKELEYQLKALEIFEKVLPANHPSLATSYNNVGATYGALGDHEKELEYQLKALKIRETVLPANHPDLALSYNNVGATCGALGDHEKDLEYQLKALEIREKVLPANHPDLALSYNNVGCTYGELGNHEKALEYGERALAIAEHSFPEGHPNMELFRQNVEVLRTWL